MFLLHDLFTFITLSCFGRWFYIFILCFFLLLSCWFWINYGTDYNPYIFLRSALEQKKSEEEKQYGVIDYDAPVKTESSTIGLGTKVHCFISWCVPLNVWLGFSELYSYHWFNILEWNWIDWSRSCSHCVWVGFCTWRFSSFWKVWVKNMQDFPLVLVQTAWIFEFLIISVFIWNSQLDNFIMVKLLCHILAFFNDG